MEVVSRHFLGFSYNTIQLTREKSLESFESKFCELGDGGLFCTDVKLWLLQDKVMLGLPVNVSVDASIFWSSLQKFCPI